MGDQNASYVTHDTPNAAPVMLLKGNHEGQVPRRVPTNPRPRVPSRPRDARLGHQLTPTPGRAPSADPQPP